MPILRGSKDESRDGRKRKGQREERETKGGREREEGGRDVKGEGEIFLAVDSIIGLIIAIPKPGESLSYVNDLLPHS